jgi:hypothetical protein
MRTNNSEPEHVGRFVTITESSSHPLSGGRRTYWIVNYTLDLPPIPRQQCSITCETYERALQTARRWDQLGREVEEVTATERALAAREGSDD